MVASHHRNATRGMGDQNRCRNQRCGMWTMDGGPTLVGQKLETRAPGLLRTHQVLGFLDTFSNIVEETPEKS